MARPTDEKKDRIVKLRVSEDLYADLVSRGPNLSDTIRKILKGDGSVPQNNDRGTHLPSDLTQMATCFGVSGEELLKMVVDGLDVGELTVQNGKLMAVEEGWVTNFRDTCHDLCIPVEKTAESACKALRKGII